jgi:ABC-type multidrug transport system ATPase subunit
MALFRSHVSVEAAPVHDTGLAIEVDSLTRTVYPRHRPPLVLLDDVSFRVEPGELVAIVGGSGAGKTTLLEAVAGVAPATSGTVRLGGIDPVADADRLRSIVGYVPQDDIVHLELPLGRMLRYAAQLRLPSSTSRDEVTAAVDGALHAVGLEERRDVRVDALSGGQRKRASIAVELLTRPRVFFLDEPTSGLDPVTRTDLVGHLRELADESTTVVFTTHSIEDLEPCDRIIFMAHGGRLAFAGCLDEAFDHFGVDSIAGLYRRLADPEPAPGARTRASAHAPIAEASQSTPAPSADGPERRPPGGLRQWSVLTRRTLETFGRNRLTLAILLGSPAMVVAMFAVLFRPGAFDLAHPSPSSMVMIGFWVVFGAFFFGLTYGLLQICTEQTILRREHFVGLRLSAYIASKVAVLVPFLLLVVVAMLAVLRVLDRLPSRSFATYASMGTTLLLCSVAALALGLLASAAVGTVAQATLALPMLCFPAVLFSGAILPVHIMAGVGAAFSVIIPSRWGFEAIGHDIGARHILARGGSPLGRPLLASYGDAGTSAITTYWLIMAGFAVVLLVATWFVLARRAGTPT